MISIIMKILGVPADDQIAYPYAFTAPAKDALKLFRTIQDLYLTKKNAIS